MTKGDITFQGNSLLEMLEKELRKIRGAQIGMIFQNAAASLCPVRTIGDQICECMSAHRKMTKGETRERAGELFRRLGLPDTERILDSYPHEVSGGECQRAAIARALAIRPEILICDEATSALDVVVQKQIMDLLAELKEEYGMSYLFISHDLALVQDFCDRVIVMHNGKVVEEGKTDELIMKPRNAYTKRLIEAGLNIF